MWRVVRCQKNKYMENLTKAKIVEKWAFSISDNDIDFANRIWKEVELQGLDIDGVRAAMAKEGGCPGHGGQCGTCIGSTWIPCS